jgi:hypothetical protein
MRFGLGNLQHAGPIVMRSVLAAATAMATNTSAREAACHSQACE